ncbi:hypothetical protein [Streptomyces sp. NPDC058374]|uniref:hypothetical protein n=1 Tax=unclassified Streptomyces TaxID=2593676 RepID=UPI003650C48C
MSTADAERPARAPSRARRAGRGFSAAASGVLLVVTALLVPLAILSGWARLDIGDVDEYVGTMAPLASDEHVQDDIAAAVTDRVMRELDTGPLQDTVAEFVQSAIRSFTTTETFRTGWNAANREAHAAVQRALREGDGNGAVTLNLAPITQQVKDQLEADGVPFADRVPVEDVEVTILEAHRFPAARQSFRLLQEAGLWLSAAAVVTAAVGLFLARRRARAAVLTCLGGALTCGALLTGIMIGRRATLDELPPDVSEGSAAAVFDALTSAPRTLAWAVLGGLLVLALVVAVLAGLRRGRPARR